MSLRFRSSLFSVVAAFALTLLLAPSGVAAGLELPAMFTDGAVLQQGVDVPVWGTAEAGAKVTVSFAGQKKTTKAGQGGKWLVTLDPLKKNSNGATLLVESATKGNASKVPVTDILVGEVWFCSGQSNMEMTFGGSIKPSFIDPDKLSMIRHIKVPHVKAGKPAADFKGKWQVCSEKSVGRFTAAGFYFAYQLQKELDTPVGLVGCNWGGTRIEPWIPPQGFAGVKKLDAAKLGDKSTMYHGMVAAVQPYAVKGALWYQGESNGNEGETYYLKMKALVEGWRKTWKNDKLPFYFVQLASFRNPNPNPAGGDGWARLREAQLKTIRMVPQTGMAVISDIGEPRNIHPKNKFDVGRRLAIWALAKDYGKKDLVFSGPLYKSSRVEGNKIRIRFDHTGKGLIAAKKEGPRSINPPKPVEKLTGFAIAGADKKWVWANATIDGETVIVSSPDVAAPVAVRYGFSTNTDNVNLYNKDHLPASPFRTDNW